MKKKKLDKQIRKQTEIVDEIIRELDEKEIGGYKGSIEQKIAGGEKTAIEAEQIAKKELEEENSQNNNKKSTS